MQHGQGERHLDGKSGLGDRGLGGEVVLVEDLEYVALGQGYSRGSVGVEEILLEGLAVMIGVQKHLDHATMVVFELTGGFFHPGAELVHLLDGTFHGDVEVIVVVADPPDGLLGMQPVGVAVDAEAGGLGGGLPAGIVQPAVYLRGDLCLDGYESSRSRCFSGGLCLKR